MTIACVDCPLRQHPLFIPFTREELAFMTQFKKGELVIESGATILMEGSNSPQLFTVLKGFGTRYTTLENGRRQVISFLFPGDFVGLQAGLMGEMRHSVDATTDILLCVFSRSELWNLFKSQPERSYDLTWIAAVEEHFLGETIATLGQRDASQRVAWAFLRMFQRLRAVGLGGEDHVPLPFRQQDLADALGLSLVHTNKTIKRLREAGLANWSAGRLFIGNTRKLADHALCDIEAEEKRPLM